MAREAVSVSRAGPTKRSASNSSLTKMRPLIFIVR